MTSQSASWGPAVLVGTAVLAMSVLGRRALESSRTAGLDRLLGPGALSPSEPGLMRRFRPNERGYRAARSLAAAAVLVWFGFRLAGLGGMVAGAGIGCGFPLVRAAHRRRRTHELLESQMAEVAESTAMAVRSGLSIRQALRFAASEVGDPIKSSVEEMLRATALGAPLERAMARWAEGVGSGEATLLALVLTVHARSGGDLGGALQEVAGTIRHRISIRRELRAMSAQGRISGAILGSLPIAFFLVLAATSRSQMAPVYRSSPGVAMLTTGLVFEALAYLWIRRLLRVEV